MKTDDGLLYVIAGASRSGKTAWCVREVRRTPRAMAWDPEAQWCDLPGWRKVTTRADLMKWAQHPGPMKIAFVPGSDLKGDFDFWCDAVMFAGRYRGPLAAVAEELADVTTPSKAPGAWGILLRRGLKRGISIYAISQRWAEADKTAIGNASQYVCFAMRGDDVAYMARKTRIPEADLAKLQALEWVAVNAYGNRIGGGRLRF
ncbi:hypothetical protein [uncultured Hydrogenophaga sp.]|uniref:hypothetical protein n=1 Tax=uncultured Hydrogenophaga sp. TaxID=199683 RepID=UPI00265FE4F7|nr:hypothetical protein [uncultured Hydrogenophaga sp.]